MIKYAGQFWEHRRKMMLKTEHKKHRYFVSISIFFHKAIGLFPDHPSMTDCL